MNNVTRNQWLGLAILLSSILMGGASQLDVLFGPTASKSIVAAMILTNAFLAGAIVILGGQGQQVRDVRNMDGVQHIEVNAKANPTLATMAMDPTETKIAPSQAAARQVEATAEAAKAG